ncbi:hypothetical protein GQ53DRAFT_736562 [Thozetella sp. PMI_491]|nr:hypothetical protein GQ53DRAFT_736562 [Thozetella sp. PMI_491]
MPPVNQAVLASAGIIAVSVAVAAAIAVYESPELRRMADDFRRRIAIALHSLGDNVDPSNHEPRFNRPEDAEGFLQSRGAVGESVEADDETRRRQREELMYWNAIREQKERERREAEERETPKEFQGATFDDFMKPDSSGERGTYVFNTGAEVRGRGQDDNLLRRRGPEGVRGLSATVYANPFADENGVDDFDDNHPSNLIAPEKDEVMTDIYGATPLDGRTVQSETFSPKPATPELLFDFDESRSHTLSRHLTENEFMTAGQEDRHEAYASIQAWAENTTDPSSGRASPNPMSFYSPLPVTPAAPISEPEIVSDGQLTPTYSASEVGTDLVSSGVPEHDYDVMSQDSEADGLTTPNSWSEVGSVVSENDAADAVHS